MPMRITVGHVLLLGQHVAHRARFHRRQFFFFVSGFHSLEHLSLGPPSQYQLGPLRREWKVESRGWRIETDGRPQLGIPKLRIAASGGPGSPHHADETVLA